jgi:hypothetical protein
MRKNMVLLDLEEYNALRDLKLKIEEGSTLTISNGGFYPQIIITTDEAVRSIAEKNNLLAAKVEDLKKMKNSLLLMSCREFRRWRKSNIPTF